MNKNHELGKKNKTNVWLKKEKEKKNTTNK